MLNHKKIGRIIQIAFAIYIVARVIMTIREIVTLSKLPKNKPLQKVDASRGILRGVFEQIAAATPGNKGLR